MDDDAPHSGVANWAWYQLGRMTARTDRVRAEAAAAATSRRHTGRVDVNATLALNRQLVADNEQLRHQLNTYHENYTRLKEWADRAEAELARLRAAKA